MSLKVNSERPRSWKWNLKAHRSKLLRRALNSSLVSSATEVRKESDEFLLSQRGPEDGSTNPDFTCLITGLLALEAAAFALYSRTHSHIGSEHAIISAARSARCKLRDFKSKFIVVFGK
jgi:hypothetical protein